MKDRVSLSINDGIADVRLIRSDKMNALDEQMFDAIIEVGEQLRNDKSVRVVVLSGEGKAFCAGLDMGNFAAAADPDATFGCFLGCLSKLLGRLFQWLCGFCKFVLLLFSILRRLSRLLCRFI